MAGAGQVFGGNVASPASNDAGRCRELLQCCQIPRAAVKLRLRIHGDRPDSRGTQPDGAHEVEVVRRGLRLTGSSERIRNLPSVQGNFSRFWEETKTDRLAIDHLITSRGEVPRVLQGRS